MPELAKMEVSTMEGDTMSEITPKKVPVNVYFPPELHRDIQFQVLEQKGIDRTYSVTQFVEDSTRLYLMALRYKKDYGITQDPYDMVMESLKATVARKRK